MVEIERSLELPASIDADGAGEHLEVTVDAAVMAEPEEALYDDGRIVTRATATVSAGGGLWTTALRRSRTPGGAPRWRGDLTDVGQGHGPPASVTAALGVESAAPVLSITGDAARRLADAADGIRTALAERRSRLQSDHGMTVEEEERWVRGSGGLQAAHATGVVTVDGDSLPVLWRDGPDVGHQVWVQEDEVDLDAFADRVVDAAIALAAAESPLTGGARR
jgi:hypothetical protein